MRHTTQVGTPPATLSDLFGGPATLRACSRSEPRHDECVGASCVYPRRLEAMKRSRSRIGWLTQARSEERKAELDLHEYGQQIAPHDRRGPYASTWARAWVRGIMGRPYDNPYKNPRGSYQHGFAGAYDGGHARGKVCVGAPILPPEIADQVAIIKAALHTPRTGGRDE